MHQEAASDKLPNYLFLLLSLTFVGCGTSLEVPLKKPAGQSKATGTLDRPEVQKQFGKALTYTVRFPDSLKHQELSIQARVDIDGEGTPTVKILNQPSLQVSKIERNEAKVDLLVDLVPLLDQQPRSIPAPAKPAFDTPTLMSFVGEMIKVNKSFLWKTLASSHCTSYIIGKSLIMTNHHCISHQQHCDNASFKFTKAEAGGLLGPTTRTYVCKKLILTHQLSDWSLVEVEGNPAEVFGKARFLWGRESFSVGTQVAYIANNPTKRGGRILAHCKILGTYVTTDPTIGPTSLMATCNPDVQKGDSGSPVFNYHGDLVAILWGGGRGQIKAISSAIQNYTLFTPLTDFLGFEGLRPLLEARGVEFVVR